MSAASSRGGSPKPSQTQPALRSFSEGGSNPVKPSQTWSVTHAPLTPPAVVLILVEMLAPDVIGELQRRVGAANVLTAKEDLIPYSFDGTAALRQMPGCVVWLPTPQEVSRGASARQRRQNPRRHPRLRHRLERRQRAQPGLHRSLHRQNGPHPGIGPRQPDPAGRSRASPRSKSPTPPRPPACFIRPIPAR